MSFTHVLLRLCLVHINSIQWYESARRMFHPIRNLRNFFKKKTVFWNQNEQKTGIQLLFTFKLQTQWILPHSYSHRFHRQPQICNNDVSTDVKECFWHFVKWFNNNIGHKSEITKKKLLSKNLFAIYFNQSQPTKSIHWMEFWPKIIKYEHE